MIFLAVDFEMINRVLPVTFDDGLTLAVDFALDPATMEHLLVLILTKQ